MDANCRHSPTPAGVPHEHMKIVYSAVDVARALSTPEGPSPSYCIAKLYRNEGAGMNTPRLHLSPWCPMNESGSRPWSSLSADIREESMPLHKAQELIKN